MTPYISRPIRKLTGLLLLILLSVTILLVACSPEETALSPAQEQGDFAFPEERPDIGLIASFYITYFASTHTGENVTLTEDTANHLFNDCEVRIATDDITVSVCEFANSRVILEDAEGVVFEQVIFRDLNQYEQSALSINNSTDVTVTDCQFTNNYIGLGIHGSSARVFWCKFEHNNGHNALVIGEGSSVDVDYSQFYGSFPHAILIMNREGESHTAVNITNNYIDQTGEDAIDFEDYRNAAPSRVADNIITNSGWAAVVVEYNSWEANITIEGNWIENTGVDWELPVHDLQPDSFQHGWGHGILIEDCSGVNIVNNRITGAGENGIEITNGRGVVVSGNGIDCGDFGIGVHGYNEASLNRSFSPLTPEEAGSSYVTADSNVVFSAQGEYDVDRNSHLSIQ